MSSRGSVAAKGFVDTDEYETTHHILDAKVLKGKNGKHSLPDYSHTPGSIYVKLQYDGKTLKEIRFYGADRKPIIEIGYHQETKINDGNKENRILHFHLFEGVRHLPAQKMTKEVKEKYKKYLEEFGLYD